MRGYSGNEVRAEDTGTRTTHDPMESTMNTMLRWSPTRKFHFHHDVDDLFLRFFDGVTDETVQRPASWLPAAEGRIEDGTYVIQLALPGVDPKDVAVSLMDNVLTVKGERKRRPRHHGQGLLRPRGRVRRIPAELRAPRGRRRRPSRGEVRERHARGEDPRAASRNAENDRSQGRLMRGRPGAEAVPVPTRTRPGSLLP